MAFASIKKKRSKGVIYDNQELVFVPGQRGKRLLLIDGYTYAYNNKSGDTTYWICRIKIRNHRCHARAMTSLKNNGLYTIHVTNPNHSHPKILKYEKYNKND